MSPMMILVLALGAMFLYSAFKGGSPLTILHGLIPSGGGAPAPQHSKR